ncbi:MAG: ABC transporter permease [Candidatus Marinimicrobia bacterium]|nr:ABC transporter permease [Candidatus Neomarinimicrobiota bacterium]
MIKFLLKGVFRDHHRSFFPAITVSIGVALTVLMNCYLTGVFGDMIDINAKFQTGHVKVMTLGYADNINQLPNDYAMVGVDEILSDLHNQYPTMTFIQRIKFGGLLDVADENGETKIQGPTMGTAVDLLSENSTELDRLNITKSVIRGELPQKPGEILISDDFAKKLDIEPGQEVTLLSSTMYGSMAIRNFVISGTIRFGVSAMDKSAIMMDITDAQSALNMENATGEILGYFSDNFYDNLRAETMAQDFNTEFSDPNDEFSLTMSELKEQSGLSEYLDYANHFLGILIFVFIFAMSLVLWNSGLLGALRRYGEIGVRLAIGEHKGHIYRSMIVESIGIGIIGSILGTIIGLGFSYWLTKGIDISAFTQSSSMMMPSVYRAVITRNAYYIGFIPGLFATVIGTMLAGIGIYRRQTASLFKELET